MALEDQRELERVLITALNFNSYWTKNIFVPADMFMVYKELASCMLSLIKKSRVPDVMAVMTEGSSQLSLQLMEIVNEAPTMTFQEFEAVVSILFDRYIKKSHLLILGEAYKIIDQGGNPLEAMKSVSDSVEELYKKDDTQTFEKQVQNTIAEIDKAMSGDSGISWGWEHIDDKAGRLQAGDLIILAGRAGMGKTEFALKIAEHSGLVGAGIISLEMPHTQLIQRYFQGRTGISVMKMRSGKTTKDELMTIIKESENVVKLKLQIVDNAYTLPEVEHAIYRMVHAGAKIVIVDYLQIIQSEGGNRDQELGKMTRTLKQLARRLEIPLIVLSQVSRKCEDRGDKRPMLADLRESGNLESDADMVVMAYREQYYVPTCGHTVTEIIFRKHRHGFTGNIPMLYKSANYYYSSEVDEWYKSHCKGEAFGPCPGIEIDNTLPRTNRNLSEPIDF